MLDKLQSLHTEILTLLDELEQLASAPLPNPGLLSSLRYQLTRASRSRTLLLESAYRRLGTRVVAGEIVLIDRLRSEGKDQLISSTQHIGTWNVSQVTTQWDAYRAASHTMRAAMRARIAAEKKIYPLLDRS